MPVGGDVPSWDGAPNAQPRLATCFLRHTTLQRALITRSGMQEATVPSACVTKLFHDKDVSDVFMISVCTIFTSAIIRCSSTPRNRGAREHR